MKEENWLWRLKCSLQGLFYTLQGQISSGTIAALQSASKQSGWLSELVHYLDVFLMAVSLPLSVSISNSSLAVPSFTP